MDHTRDPVYQVTIEARDKVGFERLGLQQNFSWQNDPRHLVFTFSRYKFVAKMLSGKARVIEIGCGDGYCARLVKQEVKSLAITDREPLFIDDINERRNADWPIEAFVHDVLSEPLSGNYDAAYALDVLEHIPAEQEDRFIENIKCALTEHGVLIIGMPSIESQSYASPPSRAGHINCKTGSDLKSTMERHFQNVFMFSMNDEVVHTGFSKLAHYLIAVCASKR